MKKIVLVALLSALTLSASSEIKPQSVGTYKTEYIGGYSDIFVRLNYSTSGDYYAFVLREMSIDNYFNLVLGTSPQEAKASIEALYGILDNGSKGELFKIDDEISIKKQNNNMLYVYSKYLSDKGYIQRRHLNAAIDFINMCIPK